MLTLGLLLISHHIPDHGIDMVLVSLVIFNQLSQLKDQKYFVNINRPEKWDDFFSPRELLQPTVALLNF